MNLKREVFFVSKEEAGERLDKLLSDKMAGLTRSRLKNLIEEGKVKVDGLTPGKAGLKLKFGQEIDIQVPPPQELSIEGENIPLDITYEDNDVIVINKPQGMVVHPAKGHYSGTLVNAILFHCSDLSGINGRIRPGIVHRLDKDTSGLLMVAKNDMSHLHLAEQLKQREVKREYLALIHGRLPSSKGTIDAPLGRHIRERKKIAVSSRASKEAVTHFNVLEEFKNTSLIKLILETGRTHQIRVHMSYIGHPILGDPLYGRRKENFKLPGQALHAGYLGFVHPRTGRFIEFHAEPPAVFQETLEALKKVR